MALFVLASASGASIGPVLGGGFGPAAAALNGSSSGGAGPFAGGGSRPASVDQSARASAAKPGSPGPLAQVPALGARPPAGATSGGRAARDSR
jgi:hypothetical protein